VFRRRLGFTLAELLTVLAIMLVLAGLLFPVFSAAKEAARRGQCLTNFRSAQQATMLYMGDYDNRFMPVNHRPGTVPNARLDRTWVQLALPYVRSFSIFKCPSDTSEREQSETAFDEDLSPGEVYAKYYTASMHINMGYNFLNLAPIVSRAGEWVSEPKVDSSVADTSKTLLFVDSIWDRDMAGKPVGGGSWLVVPPCRYKSDFGRRVDTFGAGGNVYTPFVGWDVNPKSPRLYGNAWPWHSGRVNVVRVDGSAISIPPGRLTAGCSVATGWNGTIRDPSAYLWDSE
jgi:prepilin-type N-terminal cleavage/methylation domain-containing protein/prepilin-type processing-associated H-X9-DG protein